MELETVRRCERCAQPAVIVVNHWERWLLGLLHTGPARTDHRCQSCGASFTLRTHLLLRFVIGSLLGVQITAFGSVLFVGAFLALLVQGPLVSLVLAVMWGVYVGLGLAVTCVLTKPQIRAWRNPVVPGALMPEMRLGPPEDQRVCRCGQPARCIRMKAHTNTGLPTGTDSTYGCEACGRHFTVPDGWSVGFGVAATTFLGTIALFLASLLPFDELGGGNIFCLAVLGLGALLGALLTALSLYQRHRHPRTSLTPAA